MATAMATIFIYREVGVSLTGSSEGEELHVLSVNFVKRTVSVSNLCYHCICMCIIFQALSLT